MKDNQYLPGLKGLAYSSVEGSSFEVDEWGLLDWTSMLEKFPKLEELVEMAKLAGVDGREAFFALSGYDVVGDSPTATAWRAILDTPAWRKAKSKAKGKMDKAAMLTSMLRHMGRRELDREQDLEQDPDGDEMDLDLSKLAEELPLATDVPTEGELEKGEAIVSLVRVLSGAMSDKDNEETLDEAMNLSTLIDLGLFKDLIGFTNRVVKGASRKAETARGEMVGYRADSWSDKVVSNDMMAVARGDLEALARLAEGQLQTRKFEGEITLGKGPCILLRDETYSMKATKLHAPALSLEIAMANSFNKDGRDLCTVAWGGDETRTHTWGTNEITYYHTSSGKATKPHGISEHLKGFINGTFTHIYNALDQALDLAEEYVSGADILILTDGELGKMDVDRLNSCETLKAKLERFREDRGRIWVIVLGDLDKDKWFDNLPIANGIVQVDDVNTGKGLEEILENMADRSSESSLKRRFVE